ncbi:diol dehydratase reactivase subunit alpha [Sporolituus thermophilus]|uniref:Diol dehydratase reactivase alpha subunit n=1 Tax=Sporolituus thermophilus DSM 23256 TaxID=1123285 RepID=A0A1G7M431_9FIRM|nr:diol dehydratase reactivase subunit alpha [Sporolituus thermophilus]SDF56414.1 diol dehydratase reactivase alpha subunit [Sporolituus thermophilus DSM 23256]
MAIIAGVDIGNSTTEVCIASINANGTTQFLASSIAKTTGIKGTTANLPGIVTALEDALKKAGLTISQLAEIRLNEATPVIGDVAMETITETIITESTMIGHNPGTPGGIGLGVGRTVAFADLPYIQPYDKVICVIGAGVDFADAAAAINSALERGVDVQGAVVRQDDAVLIANRLTRSIPIVDEVTFIEKVPLGMPAALEVAEPGQTIRTLSNPYGIATVFNLSSEETKLVVPIARALIGNRSAVVIRTPQGDVKARTIPAGFVTVVGQKGREDIDLDAGASKIMAAVERVQPVIDVKGEAGTNVGGMLERVRQVMSELTGQVLADMRIQDILAVDTFVPQKVQGGLAGEFALESAVALAAMVKTSRLPMQQIADELTSRLGVPVIIAGVEANMAILGALTTPGTAKPLAILDMGGGSTDAAIITRDNRATSIHLAGAGDMVTMLINSELSLNNWELAEDIKKYPLAKVESLYHIRTEDGTVRFYQEHLPPEVYARVVILKENGMTPIPADHPMEKIRHVRREAKKRVFVTNALRALTRVAPTSNIRHIDFVVMVGGSALDFEIADMVSDALAEYGIVCGRGNIRGCEGPRNAVATGLVLSYPGGRRENNRDAGAG